MFISFGHYCLLTVSKQTFIDCEKIAGHLFIYSSYSIFLFIFCPGWSKCLGVAFISDRSQQGAISPRSVTTHIIARLQRWACGERFQDVRGKDGVHD